MTTLAIGGMALAIRVLPYIEASTPTIQGPPMVGKSTGITDLARFATDLVAPAAARIASQALHRVGDMGSQTHQAQGRLGGEFAVARITQGNRHRGDQRLAGDSAMPRQVAP